jgi:hypothetical protein
MLHVDTFKIVQMGTTIPLNTWSVIDQDSLAADWSDSAPSFPTAQQPIFEGQISQTHPWTIHPTMDRQQPTVS